MDEQPSAIIAENREEWERLLRLLKLGEHKVFWISCDTDQVWLHMLPALRESLPDHTQIELRIDAGTGSLYRALLQAAAQAGGADIINVLGIGAAVESGAFLRSLNLERELLFRKAPAHIVIWGSDAAHRILATRAADWWSWMVFIFPFHTPKGLLNARQQGMPEIVQLGKRTLLIDSKEGEDRIRHLKQELEDFWESINSRPETAAAAGELADIALALGAEYREAGKHRHAAEMLGRIFYHCDHLLGEAKKAAVLNALGLCLMNSGSYEKAEPLMRRALEIDEQSFGMDHPNVARDLNNLAQLLKDTNRLAEAEPLMRRALEIDEQSFGLDHPDVAIDLNNLAQLLQDTNRLAEAEPLMRRALEIDEQSFGLDHPKIAIRLNNLAQLLQATNRLAEAEPLMRRALDMLQHIFGNAHPHTIIVRENYTGLLTDMGKSAQEIEAILGAVSIPQR
jgi:tetratricopeptide (TPR) repeat protein